MTTLQQVVDELEEELAEAHHQAVTLFGSAGGAIWFGTETELPEGLGFGAREASNRYILGWRRYGVPSGATIGTMVSGRKIAVVWRIEDAEPG